MHTTAVAIHNNRRAKNSDRRGTATGNRAESRLHAAGAERADARLKVRCVFKLAVQRRKWSYSSEKSFVYSNGCRLYASARTRPLWCRLLRERAAVSKRLWPSHGSLHVAARRCTLSTRSGFLPDAKNRLSRRTLCMRCAAPLHTSASTTFCDEPFVQVTSCHSFLCMPSPLDGTPSSTVSSTYSYSLQPRSSWRATRLAVRCNENWLHHVHLAGLLSTRVELHAGAGKAVYCDR